MVKTHSIVAKKAKRNDNDILKASFRADNDMYTNMALMIITTEVCITLIVSYPGKINPAKIVKTISKNADIIVITFITN